CGAVTDGLTGIVSRSGTGRLLVSSGTVITSGSTAFVVHLALGGGDFYALSLHDALPICFDMSGGGTLGGPGTAIISGAGTWTNDIINGDGTTTVNGTPAITATGIRDSTTRSVNFAGTTTWTNTANGNGGQFRTGSAASLNNSGTWLDQTTLDTSISKIGRASCRERV